MSLRKQCPRCGERAAFGVDRSRADGKPGWCLSCKADSERARKARNRASERLKCRQRYRENPDKWKAKVSVRRAVAAGRVKKPVRCSDCREAKRLEAHHWLGYERKHWLAVVWLCRSCHHLRHRTKDEGRQQAA